MALKVKIGADASSFHREMNKVEGKSTTMAQKMKSAGKAAAIGIGVIAVAAAAAAVAVGRLGIKMIDIGENANTADDRLAHIVKQMNVFGGESEKVSDRLLKVARAQSMATAVDIKSIKATQAKLATFKELLATADEVGGSFDRATQAALDMAAAGFGEAEQNAVQLGKALQDPIKGITALARSGVTFTQQEKDKIRTLVESNRILEAQRLILTAIETQVGGTAAKTANGLAKIKNAISLVIEDAAKPLARSFEQVAQTVMDMGPKIEAFMESLAPKIRLVGDTIATAISEAVEGDSSRLVAIGGLIGDLINEGIKISLASGWGDIQLAIRERLSGEFLGIPIMPPKYNETTIEAREAQKGLAALQFSQAAQELVEKFRMIAAMPPNTEMQIGSGVYRYAQAGEQSGVRDAQGNMLILLRNIEQNTAKPAFPN
jgi:hypothetical protein